MTTHFTTLLAKIGDRIMTFSNCYTIANDIRQHRKRSRGRKCFSLFHIFVTNRKNIGNIPSDYGVRLNLNPVVFNWWITTQFWVA